MKFKVGDRVVVAKSELYGLSGIVISREEFIASLKIEEAKYYFRMRDIWEYVKLDTEVANVPAGLLVLEEVYNSPLYQALREDD